jgi:hypothetical protein
LGTAGSSRYYLLRVGQQRIGTGDAQTGTGQNGLQMVIPDKNGRFKAEIARLGVVLIHHLSMKKQGLRRFPNPV